MACCFNKTYSTILVVCLNVALCTGLVAASSQMSTESPIIREEDREKTLSVECCPSDEVKTEPRGGYNQQNMYSELYRYGADVQQFFEYACKPDVLNKPCKFIDPHLQAQSLCVQKYSYTQALIQNKNGEKNRTEESQEQEQGNISTSSWTLDYIRVRSGCACEILPNRTQELGAETLQ